MISIVIPAYNEAGNIKTLTLKLREHLESKEVFEIIFIDDGSTDSTLDEIKGIMKTENYVKFISFSRNFGHQKAIKAGLDYAKGACAISMDADMQHPPELINRLINKWREGYDVVFTIRKDSINTSFLKRATSELFYKSINKLSDIYIPAGAADFRLLDRIVIDEFKKFKENWIFIRGLVSWLGFRQIGIEYTVQKRYMGRSKYSFSKMIGFAIQGITSFSILPLRIATGLGVLFSISSFIIALYALYTRIFTNETILGWASLLISVLFLGGIQLISLGLIGEYIGKMFIETKERPAYIIKEKSL